MKKRTPKVVLTSLMLILTLSVMALLTGCGGTPTLEEYINDNPKEQEAMDSELDKANVTLAQSGMSATIDIKENQVIYTLKLGDMYKGEDMNPIKEYLEQYLETLSSNYETLADTLEKETKIEGVTVRVVCVDPNDEEICRKDYKPSK